VASMPHHVYGAGRTAPFQKQTESCWKQGRSSLESWLETIIDVDAKNSKL